MIRSNHPLIRLPRRVLLVALGWLLGTGVACRTDRNAREVGRSLPVRHPRSSSRPEPNELGAEVLAAHNAARFAKGLPPVVLDPELTSAAQAHADDMATRGRMTHRGGDGSSPFDRIERAGYEFREAAENVAYGFDQVDQVMAGWLRSPGHRRNILGPYQQIGVGRATAPGGATYWCVTFGTPRSVDFGLR